MDRLVDAYRVSGAFHPDISLAIADYYGKTGDDANRIRRVRSAAEKADGFRTTASTLHSAPSTICYTDLMVAAIRQQVTVQPGGLVEVRSPELQPGARAEVIVLVEAQNGDQPRRSLDSFIGAGKGGFGTAEEVDAYIRGLRDEWER